MNTPTPILFTIPNFDTAGSGNALWNVVSRLDRGRFAPAICVLRPGGKLASVIENSDVPLLCAKFTVPMRPLATFPFRVRAAARPFRGRGFALWHSYHYTDDYTEPLVARMAGTRSWIYTKKNMNWHKRSWYVRSLLATRIAAQNTDMLRRFFAPAALRRRARLVPRGVDTARFSPDRPSRLGLRAEWKVSNTATVVGCVAHLIPVKNQEMLIRAVAKVPGTVLWLAGREDDPTYVAKLRRLVAELLVSDRVMFFGDIQDIPSFLAEIDVFALPTRAEGRMEGCPVALLEAMATGRACLATDIPGSRDLVEPGRSGGLVPPDDTDALAEEIRRLAEDPAARRALGEAARRRVVERYSIEREVEAHESLYDEVLGRASMGSAA